MSSIQMDKNRPVVFAARAYGVGSFTLDPMPGNYLPVEPMQNVKFLPLNGLQQRVDK
jgi:hypothetical protein